MCGPEPHEIETAKETFSDATCPDCGKLLREHDTLAEAGYLAFTTRGVPAEASPIVEKGDILLLFENGGDGLDFVQNPYAKHPRDAPKASVVVASGLVGKRISDIEYRNDLYVDGDRLVIIRPLRASPSAPPPAPTVAATVNL